MTSGEDRRSGLYFAKAWHPGSRRPWLSGTAPSVDLATPDPPDVPESEESGSSLKHEAAAGGEMYIGIEPKPNEIIRYLLPTVASAILLFRKLEKSSASPGRRRVSTRSHSEMIGLDHVYDSIEELDNNAMVHIHLNSQGYNDGITLGGPGKFDIDHGTKINGMNIAIAALLDEYGFNRWKGHDMQPRGYDNEEQAIDRVVRSVLSWEACAKAAAELNTAELMKYLAAKRQAAPKISCATPSSKPTSTSTRCTSKTGEKEPAAR